MRIINDEFTVFVVKKKNPKCLTMKLKIIVEEINHFHVGSKYVLICYLFNKYCL